MPEIIEREAALNDAIERARESGNTEESRRTIENKMVELESAIKNQAQEFKESGELKTVKPEVDPLTGKLKYYDSAGKQVKFGGKDTISEYIKDRSVEFEKEKEQSKKEDIIEKTTEEISKKTFGLDKPIEAITDAMKGNVEARIKVDVEIQHIKSSNERNTRIAQEKLGTEIIKGLVDPKTNPEAAKQAGKRLVEDISKNIKMSEERINKSIKDLSDAYEKNNKELIDKYEKKVQELIDKTESPRDKSTLEKLKDNLPLLAALGISAYFAISFLKEHQKDLTGCFVVASDPKTKSKINSGKILNLTCGEYKKRPYGYTTYITKDNCIKNADDTYPKPNGCNGTCYTDIEGDSCVSCPDTDTKEGDDIICSKYCNNAYIKSTDPSIIYDFTCSTCSFTEAIGDIFSKAADMFGDIFHEAVNTILTLLKWTPFIILGIIVIYVIFLLVKKLFFGDSKENIIVETSSPPQHSFGGYKYGYYGYGYNNFRPKYKLNMNY